MTELDPLDRLSRVANQSEQPTPEFGDRLLTELLGDLADPSTNHTTIHTGNQQTAEVVMLSPDRNHLPKRSRTWLLVAASVAAIALVGGLVVITNQNNPAAPADLPAPVSVPTVEPEPVPAVEPEPEADAAPTFPTGATPYGVTFDGTNIWIANVNDNTVSKMSTDGTRVDYETGTLPRFVAFDGTSIWITNQRDGTVSKMNPDDGTRVDYPTGTSPDPNPHGVAFDGTSIWIANSADGTVSKMNPDDGTRVDYPTSSDPFGVVSDGTSIWITNNDGTVSKMNPADGTRVDYPADASATLMAFDGTSIWITNPNDNTVSKMNPDDGTRVDYPTGTQPFGVTFDGTSIWITNEVDGTVSKMNPADGTRVDVPTGSIPRGVTFDGTYIWVANNGDDTVSRIDPSSVEAAPLADGVEASTPLTEDQLAPTAEVISQLPATGSEVQPGAYTTDLLGVPLTFEVPASLTLDLAGSNIVSMSDDSSDSPRTLSLRRISGWNTPDEAIDQQYAGPGSLDAVDIDAWADANDLGATIPPCCRTGSFTGEPLERVAVSVGERSALPLEVRFDADEAIRTFECEDGASCLWAASLSERGTATREGTDLRLASGLVHQLWLITIEGEDPLLIHASSSESDETWVDVIENEVITGAFGLGPDAPATTGG